MFLEDKNYLSFLSFLTRFIPTPETASRSFSSAAITALVVLKPASYKALALLAPTPGNEVKVSIFFFELTVLVFVLVFVFVFVFVLEDFADLVGFFSFFKGVSGDTALLNRIYFSLTRNLEIIAIYK